MIAVDTNVLVRYAVKDDVAQTIEATDFLAKNVCWVHKTVLLETVWVLSSKAGYALSREIVVKRVRHILGLENVFAQDEAEVANALTWFEAGMDFADALHLASSDALDGFATFDRRMQIKANELNLPQSLILLGKEPH